MANRKDAPVEAAEPPVLPPTLFDPPLPWERVAHDGRRVTLDLAVGDEGGWTTSVREPNGDLALSVTSFHTENAVREYELAAAPMPDGWAPPGPNLAEHAAQRRYAAETAGIVVDGFKISTARESQAATAAAAARALRLNQPTQFKLIDGSFSECSPDQMQTILEAVDQHVAACFSAEADVVARITLGDITTTEEIDAAPWPA